VKTEIVTPATIIKSAATKVRISPPEFQTKNSVMIQAKIDVNIAGAK